jgi:CDP-diacylglycerol--serine O-phosphatidyltransferase
MHSALQQRLSLAISFMALAMLTDMLDGPVARRTGGSRPFGTQLDSFIDVFVYLVAPALILYEMGQGDPFSLAGLLAYFAAGVARLSHFNLVGAEPDPRRAGVTRHIGLPVIWSQLLTALAFPAWHLWGPAVRPVIAASLLIQSALMVSRLRFRKLTWYGVQAVLILVVASAYLALHLHGVYRP